MRRVWFLVGLVACAEERTQVTCTDCATNGVHPADWVEHHGADLERRGWDFALCQGCHGSDFAGRATAPSCLTCHRGGPTACDTCHGSPATPPASGAHSAHVAQNVACSECHVVPATWDEPGHILDDNGQPIGGPARVTFGALANRDVSPPRRTSPASWDHESGTCANVYCHGGVLGDAAATHARPAWNGGPAQVACGGCHGAPPANHAQSECTVCHPGSGHGTSRHIDGVIDVASGCTGCHGQGASAAPPRGLHGETDRSSLAVGAHTAHLVAGQLRGPIACNECHVVPTSVGDAGHLDTALPAELVFGSLAASNGAEPSWNRSAATCSDVYCHGGGTKLAVDAWPEKLAQQSWSANTGATVYCGACHGLPPVDGVHAPTQTLTDCATCHPSTVGPFGNILIANGKHINGAVDLQ